jgi:hypothetical protein
MRSCPAEHCKADSCKSVVAVAQLVESRIVIPVVVGSSPISHPTVFKLLFSSCHAFIGSDKPLLQIPKHCILKCVLSAHGFCMSSARKNRQARKACTLMRTEILAQASVLLLEVSHTTGFFHLQNFIFGRKR